MEQSLGTQIRSEYSYLQGLTIQGLNVFFDLLVNALSKNPKLLNGHILYTIVWPGTASAIHSNIQLLRNKGVEIKLLPLLNREELLEMYHRSNNVITKPLDAVTRLAYRSYFGIQKIPVSEVRNYDYFSLF